MLLVGWQEGHPACKNWVVRYWDDCLSGARCKWFAYGPPDATATPIISCSSKIQNDLPFWCRLTQVVLAKRPLNGCSTYSFLLLRKVKTLRHGHIQYLVFGYWYWWWRAGIHDAASFSSEVSLQIKKGWGQVGDFLCLHGFPSVFWRWWFDDGKCIGLVKTCSSYLANLRRPVALWE